MRFSTSDVKEKDRFSYWREAVCDAYVQLGCAYDRREAHFRGEIQLERLSKLSLSRVSGDSHRVFRRRRDIARSSDACFLLSLQTKNAASVAQRGQTAQLTPGDFALYSSIEPYELRLTDAFEQLVVQVPRSKLLARLPTADLLTGRRVSGEEALGRMVGSGIRQIAEAMRASETQTREHLQDAIVDLIAAGLASLEEVPYELALPEQQTLNRAKAYVQANLSDFDLDRSRVAAAMGMSVRRLNEIFAKEDSSLAAYIRGARLERIAQDLEDPRLATVSISSLALRWGIGNFQHFSRIFKERFGLTPRDFRARAMDAAIN